MSSIRLTMPRLELTPLRPEAAALLPGDRRAAAALVGCSFADEWPGADMVDILPMQAAMTAGLETFGVWLMIERATNTVVGDIGFLGPPDGGRIELGFSVIPSRRRRGYATEAARALGYWIVGEPGVRYVVARSDADNDASAGVLAGAGFEEVAEHDGQRHWQRVG